MSDNFSKNFQEFAKFKQGKGEKLKGKEKKGNLEIKKNGEINNNGEIDNNLDSLLKEVNSSNEGGFYSYKEDEKKGYKPLVNGIVFDLYMEDYELINFLKLTRHILKLYIKGGHKKGIEKFKSGLSVLGGYKKDLYIDDSLFFDTVFLTNEGLSGNLGKKGLLKIYGEEGLSKKNINIKPYSLNTIMNKYADFLNKVLEKM